jgi:hypothetical protein
MPFTYAGAGDSGYLATALYPSAQTFPATVLLPAEPSWSYGADPAWTYLGVAA